MVSLDTSLPSVLVVNPAITFLSFTLKSLTSREALVPPMNTFPVTLRSFPIVTFPGNVGLFAIDICTSAPSPAPVTDICCAFPVVADFT